MIQIFTLNGCYFPANWNPYMQRWRPVTDGVFSTFEQAVEELRRPAWQNEEIGGEAIPWEGEVPFQNPIEYEIGQGERT